MRYTNGERPTVLIADDHVVFAEGLARSLQPDFHVLGVVSELDRIPQSIGSCRPDIVILDLSFHGESSLPVLRTLCEKAVAPPAYVILTAHSSRALASAAADAGALAFLPKDVSTRELKMVLGVVLQGRAFIRTEEPAASGKKADSDHRMIMVDGCAITPRQAQILVLLADGLSRPEVAERIEFSIKSIDYHLQKVKKALGVNRLRHLYVWATEHIEALREASEGRGDSEALLDP